MSGRKGKTNIKLATLNEINQIDKRIKRIKSKINNCSHYKTFADDTWSLMDIPEDDTDSKEYYSLIEVEKTLISKRNKLREKLKTNRKLIR